VSSDTLVISNLELGDTMFDSDVGSWNVSRAQRDCAAYRIYFNGKRVAPWLGRP
jgi:hypothetical protein